ncbi:nodulation protein NodZ [Candidatus Thiosymbion oneisti]|uniref:nodulation protein NodZ n=1 Tax=Candidatus Thiosymbion oneisti TaxID=589554 RepID=UPI00114CC053|nr:nodulation protein NodZ [Candidatus Thiosymbion oneisti]
MIQLRMQGLIGNNLFQYAFARILAEDLGYALEVKHSSYKPGKNIPQLEDLLSHFRDAPLAIDGKRFSRPVDRTALMGHNGFDGFRIDLEGMRNCRQDRKILIKGFFERYEIFRTHKSRIRSWFAVDPIDLGYHIAPDDIVIHIRRGDFIVFSRAISLSFYLDLLEKLDFARLYICGFGLDEEVKASFSKFGPIYIEGSPIDDFRFMIGFNRIIQSQSTFAWWAGFLSKAEEIHAPVPPVNATPFERRYPHIDLRVNDESRYHYVHDVPHLERAPTIADMAAARQHLSLLSKLHFLKTLLKNWLLESGVGSAVVWAVESLEWGLYRMRRYKRGRYRFDGPDQPVLGQYRKILIIRINHSYAGFFAYFTFALNQLLFCERNQCLPVVFFGKSSTDGDNAYYDPSRGENMWEYFFEPVAGSGYEQVQQWLKDPGHPLQPGDVVTLTDRDLWYLHLYEKGSIYAYPYGRYLLKTSYDARWYDFQRARAHEVIGKYVQVKDAISNRVDAFYREQMQGHLVLGIHLRGTDKGAARGAKNTRQKVKPEAYFPEVDRYLAVHPKAKLFVATDQAQYLQSLEERYAGRILSSDCYRSTSGFAPFQATSHSGYAKGAEVLIDVLLLARCDFLLKCASHVGEAALWFNPNLPSIDLNYPREARRLG